MKNIFKNNLRAGALSGLMIWGGIFVLVFGAIFLLAAFGGKGNTDGEGAVLIDAVSANDRTQGVAGALVTLVEYGDFQCPACASYHAFVKKLIEEEGDKVFFAYRHFPLRTIHKNADEAAWAAEAAGIQGKFWEMSDMIYKNQKDWEKSDTAGKIFEDYAKQLGLNVEQFIVDRDSDVVKSKVEADLQSGLRAKVTGTPTFFVNGKKITNPSSYDEFKKLVLGSSAATSLVPNVPEEIPSL